MTHSQDILLPQSTDWVETVKTKAMQNMQRYDNCTQSILAAYMEVFGIENPLLMRSAGPMLGGMTASLTCGVHTAAMMVLGLLMGREDIKEGVDGLMPIVVPAQGLIQRLTDCLGSASCLELTGTDFTDRREVRKFRISDGPQKCAERVGTGSEMIAEYLIELDKQGGLFRTAKKLKL